MCVSVHHVRRLTILICFINMDQLIKVISAKFLHCILWLGTLRLCKLSITPQTFTTSFNVLWLNYYSDGRHMVIFLSQCLGKAFSSYLFIHFLVYINMDSWIFILLVETYPQLGLSRWLSGKERRRGFDPWVRKIPWRKKWQHTPVFLPGESHGQRSLVGYGPWGPKESDMT